MPEQTKKPKPDHEKGEVKVHDLEPTKDAKGGGGLKKTSPGGGGDSTLPVPPTQQTN
jgi:hypothetical protein